MSYKIDLIPPASTKCNSIEILDDPWNCKNYNFQVCNTAPNKSSLCLGEIASVFEAVSHSPARELYFPLQALPGRQQSWGEPSTTDTARSRLPRTTHSGLVYPGFKPVKLPFAPSHHPRCFQHSQLASINSLD
jgi:hypothetical protein